MVTSEGCYKFRRKTKPRAVGEETYTKHDRVLKCLSISCHPLVPRDGLTLFEDVFDIPEVPTLRRWSREFPEWGSRTTNLLLDENKDEDEDRRHKNT